MKSKGGGGGGSSPAPVPDEYAGGAEVPPDFGDFPDDAGLASEPPPPAEFDGAVPSAPGNKPRFEGDWQCAGCNAPITSLPFQPRDTSNLKCIDCFKASRA